MKQIPLTRGHVALVDDDDYEWLNQWKWSATSDYSHGLVYATRGEYSKVTGKVKHFLMHRLIMGDMCKGMVVDHADRNPLNNQRSNLRACTQMENMHNSKSRIAGRPKGIYFRRDSGKWAAAIRVNGERHHLGLFETMQEAADAYLAISKKLVPHFHLNTIV